MRSPRIPFHLLLTIIVCMALLAIAPDAQAGKPPPAAGQFAPNHEVYFVDPANDAWNRDNDGPPLSFECGCLVPPCAEPYALQVESRVIHSDLYEQDYPLRFSDLTPPDLEGDRCGYLAIITEPNTRTTMLYFTYRTADGKSRHLRGPGTLTQSGRREPGWFAFTPTGTYELLELSEVVWSGSLTFTVQGCQMDAPSCPYDWWQ